MANEELANLPNCEAIDHLFRSVEPIPISEESNDTANARRTFKRVYSGTVV